MTATSPLDRLTAARTRLILDKPFLGALVLRLPLVEANPDWCPTVATDARAFYFNPSYIAGLRGGQLQFVLAHEALHCALAHFARRQHRVKRRWDVACDHAVNPLLLDEGLIPPPGVVILDEFRGMTAEEIYPFIEDHDDSELLDDHLYDRDAEGPGGDGTDDNTRRDDARGDQGAGDHGDDGRQQQQQASAAEGGAAAGRPPPLSEPEREQLEKKWQQHLAGAAQQAQQAGKLGGGMARLVDRLLQPRLPWRALLARHLHAIARDDYSYLRPSRREGDAILPSLRSHGLELVVALDTSGSVEDAELAAFVSEIDGLKAQVRAHVTLLACDSELAPQAPWHFQPWDAFTLPSGLHGGGGTRFTPVFDWIARQDRRPDLLIWFTDAHGEFPPRAPDYPVLWLVKGKAPVPWGERVQLN